MLARLKARTGIERNQDDERGTTFNASALCCNARSSEAVMKLLLEIGILIASSRGDDVAMIALPLAFHAFRSSILRSDGL